MTFVTAFLTATSLVATFLAFRESTNQILTHFVPKLAIPTATTPLAATITAKSTTTRPIVYNYSCGGVERETPRIVNGEEAIRNEIPWRCWINDTANNNFCGCTVIDKVWVMTAAHCTHNTVANDLRVISGPWNIDEMENESVFSFVDRSEVHPHYDHKTLNNDIALLHLQAPLTWSASINRVCLPWNSEGNNCERPISILASGWGITSEHIQATVLNKIQLPCISTAECKKYYKGTRLTQNMICTYDLGRDTCKGDSGGSIDYNEPQSGRYFAIGIVSWGPRRCGAKDRPGVYTKVTNYLEWIRTTATDATFFEA